MSEVCDYETLKAFLSELDPSMSDCAARIVRVRRLMDESCAIGCINIGQWGTLIDQVSVLRVRCMNSESHPLVQDVTSSCNREKRAKSDDADK